MTTVAVHDLRVGVGQDGSEILHGVELELDAGQIVGVAGETGSGKTTLGLALLGHLAPGLVARAGVVDVAGERTIDAERPPAAGRLRSLRGRVLSYVPQDPGGALNPGMTIGAAFAEVMRAHGEGDGRSRAARCADLFRQVGLPAGDGFTRRYPHQLSGGQQQRVAIAMAFALDPAVVVMDEPTTGLDVATKRRVSELIARLARERGSTVVLISHDLPLLIALADRIVVMHDGAIIEQGPARAVADAPSHEYTRRLIAALPRPGDPPLSPAGDPLLSVEELSARYGRSEVTHGLSLELRPGGCLAVVGESGSGKTTMARAIAGLHPDYDGRVLLDGGRLARDAARRRREERRRLQYVFQNPWGALNPRRAVGPTIALAARRLLGVGRPEARRRAATALAQVGLGPEFLDALPHRLSGGQRQRVAIARALVAEPEVMICDEVTSSLDLSVQAGVVELLQRLRTERGLALVFITHDLALAASIADRVAVLKDGAVVESGDTRSVIGRPQSAYTAELVEMARASW
ncbi:MAG: ABC transporter ATP-binding protein [Microbacterium sp.]